MIRTRKALRGVGKRRERIRDPVLRRREITRLTVTDVAKRMPTVLRTSPGGVARAPTRRLGTRRRRRLQKDTDLRRATEDRGPGLQVHGDAHDPGPQSTGPAGLAVGPVPEGIHGLLVTPPGEAGSGLPQSRPEGQKSRPIQTPIQGLGMILTR